eukprot:scaffold129857_cov66-Phaeocystis_antarctica.AAC.5
MSAAYLAASPVSDASRSAAREPVLMCSCCSAGANIVAVPSSEVIAKVGGLDGSPACSRMRQLPRSSCTASSATPGASRADGCTTRWLPTAVIGAGSWRDEKRTCVSKTAVEEVGMGHELTSSAPAAVTKGEAGAAGAFCASRKAASCRAVG